MKNTKNTTLAFFPPPLLTPTPPLVLLLLLLLSFPGGCPCPALALECQVDIVTDVEAVANITTERSGGNEYKTTTLFVNPRPDFRGVSLVVEVAGGGGGGRAASEQVVAWFSLNATCFPSTADWYQLEVKAWKNEHYGNAAQELAFSMDTHNCNNVCQRGHFRYFSSLQVRAHGASRWRLTRPDKECGRTIEVQTVQMQAPIPPCSNPPTKKNNTLYPTSPTTRPPSIPVLPTHAVVGATVTLMVAVIATFVVMVVLLRRWRRMTTTADADADIVQWRRHRSPTPSCVKEEVVNSLCEPYESLTPSCVREELVNSLYEPFESLAPSCVSEEVVNSLYEPFESLAPSCASEEVVNSLYEPFESLHQPPPAVAATKELRK